MMQKKDVYVLWLTSWYPNRQQPFDGDFIQRHARAVSELWPVTVIHVYQYGHKTSLNEDNEEVHEQGNLKEILISFKYLKTGVPVIDKLIYNIRYYSVYKKFIKKLFQKDGFPCLVHVHVPMKAGIIAQWIKKKWGIPYMISEHSSSYEEASPDFFGKRSLYYKRSVRSVFEKASIVTNVSGIMGKKINSLLGLSKKIEVVHNVVDTSLFFYKPTPLPIFRFIHVSGMSHQKNIEGIIRCFQRLHGMKKESELWLIGPADQSIRNLIESSGFENKIICKGEVSYAQVAGFMQSSSALVMFSRHENFPCVIIEALCCGLPVVASTAGGISEAVNNSNGILVPSENEDALLSAFNNIMDNYVTYDRKKIADDSQMKYRFSFAAGQFNKYYNELIQKG